MSSQRESKPNSRNDASSAPDYRLDEEALAPGASESRASMRSGSQPTHQPQERLLLRPGEAAELLAISPRKLWELTNMRELPCVRIGRSLRYPREALRTWIERRQGRQP